jgi:hypothetical protein
MQWIVIAVGVAAVLVVAAAVVHVVLTWADRRGWVWYRNADRPPPHTLGLIEEIYHPAIEHVIDEEVSEATEADTAESGAPPNDMGD